MPGPGPPAGNVLICRRSGEPGARVSTETACALFHNPSPRKLRPHIPLTGCLALGTGNPGAAADARARPRECSPAASPTGRLCRDRALTAGSGQLADAADKVPGPGAGPDRAMVVHRCRERMRARVSGHSGRVAGRSARHSAPTARSRTWSATEAILPGSGSPAIAATPYPPPSGAYSIALTRPPEPARSSSRISGSSAPECSRSRSTGVSAPDNAAFTRSSRSSGAPGAPTESRQHLTNRPAA